jgi:hypothetical protein
MEQKINVKLGKRTEKINGLNVDLYHIVIPEIQKRISDSLWQEFLRYLNRHFSRRLNWSLYKNVPVYEYRANPSDLEYSIASFLKSKNFVVSNFERFDYGSTNISLMEMPTNYHQHLAL